MKQSNHLNNIVNLKKKLMDLENSQLEIENNLNQDRSQIRNSIRNNSRYQHEDNVSYQSHFLAPQAPSHTRQKPPMIVDVTNQPNTQGAQKDYDQTIQALVKETDELRDLVRQKDVKIETLNFRCEKLQTELAMKLDTINKLTVDIEERDGLMKRLSNQNKHLETVVEKNQTDLVPEHQKLKSQYNICLLEIKSLEKDNDILEARIRELTNNGNKLKIENREVKSNNSKIEQERLKLKQDLESLKMLINKNENDMLDLTDKYENSTTENERLKNELIILKQKLDVYSSGDFEIVSSKIVSRFEKLEDKQQPEKKPEPTPLLMNYQFEMKETNPPRSKKFADKGEKLNFDDLNSLSMEFKRRFNN